MRIRFAFIDAHVLQTGGSVSAFLPTILVHNHCLLFFYMFFIRCAVLFYGERCTCFSDRRVCIGIFRHLKMRIGCLFLDAHFWQTGGSEKNAKKCASDVDFYVLMFFTDRRDAHFQMRMFYRPRSLLLGHTVYIPEDCIKQSRLLSHVVSYFYIYYLFYFPLCVLLFCWVDNSFINLIIGDSGCIIKNTHFTCKCQRFLLLNYF